MKTHDAYASSGSARNDAVRVPAPMLLLTTLVILLSGCTALPLRRFQPFLGTAPGSTCSAQKLGYFADEKDAVFHYTHPAGAAASKYLTQASKPGQAMFEDYSATLRTRVQNALPPGLQKDKVAMAFTDFLIAASAQAQLDAQIANGVMAETSDPVKTERAAIKKHSAPAKLNHHDTQTFADKFFDLQLKPGVSALTTPGPVSNGANPTTSQMFAKYIDAYYHGKFTDRMGVVNAKPSIGTTITDTEITGAETMLLEFLADLIDPTPVMGDTATITSSTNFYPGDSKNQPTISVVNPNVYVQIPTPPPGGPYPCGITTNNAWVLKDLANGASDQAAAVGGLVENTAGGLEIGLGVLGKISIGDNQTLSVMVKTAASRIALRVTLTSSYFVLRNVTFNVSQP